MSKLAIVQMLSQMAWRLDFDGTTVSDAIVQSLVKVLHLYPLSAQASTPFAAVASLVVDLLTSHATPTALASSTCNAILTSIQFLSEKQVSVLSLLQSLERLVIAAPDAGWRSEFLVWCAYFLASDTTPPLEQRLMIQVLQHVVEFGSIQTTNLTDSELRSVYVEVLVLPLTTMLSTRGTKAPQLLQAVSSIATSRRFKSGSFASSRTRKSTGSNGTISARAISFLMLVDSSTDCKLWLDSLFQPQTAESEASKREERVSDHWLAMLLVALLFDEREGLRDSAALAFERQIKHHGKFWSGEASRLLVSGLVFLFSHQSSSTMDGSNGTEWMARCLYVLAAIGATTTETMKIVLRLIDTMWRVDGMRAIALQLMLAVWEKESRVYPRLESMLLEEETDESTNEADYRVVKMAALKAFCAKDPETGVDFIAHIQSSLEDKLVSVASMAMDAVSELCRGDCLDFYAVFKIIALKMRKSKLACAGDFRFQEKLCLFYSLGLADMEENEKHASKLLTQLWEFAESEEPRVRKAAFASLCKFPLESLGLWLPEGEGAGDDDDFEPEFDQEEVDERLGLLLDFMATEEDNDVRYQVEALVTRVLDQESRHFTAGIGRGQMKASTLLASQQLVSAGATKDLKNRLPSRDETKKNRETYDEQPDAWLGFLMAFRPAEDIGSQGGKRKDRLVRLAAQNVEECENTLRLGLDKLGSFWKQDSQLQCSLFLNILSLVDAWRAFMSTYTTTLEEFAALKIPTTAEAEAEGKAFADAVSGQAETLMTNCKTNEMNLVVVGALTGRLCWSRHWDQPLVRTLYADTATSLLRQLSQALEERKVFGGSSHRSSVAAAMLGLQLSLGFAASECFTEDDHAVRDSLLKEAERVLTLWSQKGMDPLLRVCAILGLSHVGCVHMSNGQLYSDSIRHQTGELAKPIAERLLSCAAQALTQSSRSPLNVGSVFSTDGSAMTEVSLDAFKQSLQPSVSSPDYFIAWAAFIGLAQLATHFGASRRLHWLANLRTVLTNLMDQSISLAGIALGPVLLASVEYKLCSSSFIDEFIAKCFALVESSLASGGTAGDGCAFMILPFMIAGATHYFDGTSTQEHARAFVEYTRKALGSDGSSTSTIPEFVVGGVANFFNLSLGVLSGVDAAGANQTVDMVLEAAVVDDLVTAVRSQLDAVAWSRLAYGAIAGKADLFHVLQQKKVFETEIRAFPQNGLLYQTLNLLRIATLQNESPPAMQQVNSILSCLSSIGSSLPLIDYSSLLRRLIARICSVDTTSLCIHFASTQGSCDLLVVDDLASSRQLSVAPPAVLAALMAVVPKLAVRIPQSALTSVMDTIFNVLIDNYQDGEVSEANGSTSLFSLWTQMLREIVEEQVAPVKIPVATQEIVGEKILDLYLPRLPLGHQHERDVQAFASEVLAKLSCRGRAADLLLKPTAKGSKQPWLWWRNGVIFAELVRSTGEGITKREMALLFQWLLIHDYREWQYASAPQLMRLTSSLASLTAQGLKPDEIVPLLLDLVDGYTRTLTNNGVSGADGVKCATIFDFVAFISAWKKCLDHEEYLLLQPPADSESGVNLSSLRLLPGSLVQCVRASKSWIPLYEQFWGTMRKIRERSDLLASPLVQEHLHTLVLCFHSLHGVKTDINIPTTLMIDMTHWFSIQGGN